MTLAKMSLRCILKVCVCYIFASLFFKSKREHLWNKEEHFLFHLESSFHSWDNQISTFQIYIQMSWRHQMSPKHETRNTFNYIIWEANTVWKWNFASLCNITKQNFFIKKFCEKCGLETSSKPFLIFKESSVEMNLRRSAYWFW